MSNTCLKKTLVIFIIISSLLLSACAFGNKLVGEYEGTSGSFLKLNKDGSCYYGEDDSTGSGRGTWYVEDNMLHISIELFDYDVFANIEDMDGGFLLEAHASRWNAEYFLKVR